MNRSARGIGRRGASFGEGRAALPPLRCDPGPGRPEPFLFLRDLPRRGGVRGAPADAPLQALRRKEQALAGRPSRAPLRQESDSFRRRLALTLAPRYGYSFDPRIVVLT